MKDDTPTVGRASEGAWQRLRSPGVFDLAVHLVKQEVA